MRIGVPKERKPDEDRVALTPAGVRDLAAAGHVIMIERSSGSGCSIGDEAYLDAGARIVDDVAEVWGDADLVVKVKEPISEEYRFLRRGQVLFTYLHLAASRLCTEAILASGVTAIAYETVQLANGTLPLLTPMSEVAGRMSTQVGAVCLQREHGGRGVLLGGVPGVLPAKVAVLGAGVAGSSAATIAVGMRADVTVLDQDLAKLRSLDAAFAGSVRTLPANKQTVEDVCVEADLVIGAVLVAGARAPHLVTHQLVSKMKAGSVLVDLSVDQGGCMEDTRPTTHSDPTFRVERSVFYCVANMPGAVPTTSTWALTNATLPYVKAVARDGWRTACRADLALAAGVNASEGTVVNAGVGQAHARGTVPLKELLGA